MVDSKETPVPEPDNSDLAVIGRFKQGVDAYGKSQRIPETVLSRATALINRMAEFVQADPLHGKGSSLFNELTNQEGFFIQQLEAFTQDGGSVFIAAGEEPAGFRDYLQLNYGELMLGALVSNPCQDAFPRTFDANVTFGKRFPSDEFADQAYTRFSSFHTDTDATHQAKTGTPTMKIDVKMFPHPMRPDRPQVELAALISSAKPQLLPLPTPQSR